MDIASTGQNADRIKRLGEFDYVIRVKGHEVPIKRNVSILSHETTEYADQPLPRAGLGSSVMVDFPPSQSRPGEAV